MMAGQMRQLVRHQVQAFDFETWNGLLPAGHDLPTDGPAGGVVTENARVDVEQLHKDFPGWFGVDQSLLHGTMIDNKGKMEHIVLFLVLISLHGVPGRLLLLRESG